MQDILKNFQKFIEDECIKNLPHFFSVCLSESLMEYKKENFEVKEEDNEDDLDLKNEINKYTMNILDKRNEKQKNLKFGGSQEDPIYQQIHKSYLDHIIKTASKFIDNKITEEISKLMIKTFNETINNYDEVIQNKVRESMNQQSLDVMKEFNFE